MQAAYQNVVANCSRKKTERPERKGNGKAIPLQAWIDLQSSRKLRLPDIKTIGI